MPTDRFGNKWACEACVRGHRATRCDHFDRWMVRVKKPGRPLRECPHPLCLDCGCTDDKVVMLKIPKNPHTGDCNCLKIRKYDPAIDDENKNPSRHPPRQQDPSDPSRQPPGQSKKDFPEFREYCGTAGPLPTTTPGSDVKAEPGHGLAVQGDLRSQQHASDPISNDQAGSAAMPTTPIEGIQVSHQEQFHSSVTSHGEGVSRQGFSHGNPYDQHGFLPLRGNNAPHQPPFSPHQSPFSPHQSPFSPHQSPFLPHQSPFPTSSPYEHILNGSNGQQPGSMSASTLTGPPDPNQYIVNGAHPMMNDQNRNFELLNHPPPVSHDPNPFHHPTVGSTEHLDAFTNSQNCPCGPGCNCRYCSKHPYNPATIEGVQALAQTLSEPQSACGGTPTNGTNMESVAAQEYQPQHPEFFTSGTYQWTNVRSQSSAIPPTFAGGESVDNSDQSYEISSRLMQSSEYINLPYPANPETILGADTTETCLCSSDCACMGCLTQQGFLNHQGNL